VDAVHELAQLPQEIHAYLHTHLGGLLAGLCDAPLDRIGDVDAWNLVVKERHGSGIIKWQNADQDRDLKVTITLPVTPQEGLCPRSFIDRLSVWPCGALLSGLKQGLGHKWEHLEGAVADLDRG